MSVKIADLRNKQVVCIKTGEVLGFVSDVELNTDTGELTGIVLPGRNGILGLIGREEDIVIPWNNIEVIGEETVLVNANCEHLAPRRKKGFLLK